MCCTKRVPPLPQMPFLPSILHICALPFSFVPGAISAAEYKEAKVRSALPAFSHLLFCVFSFGTMSTPTSHSARQRWLLGASYLRHRQLG